MKDFVQYSDLGLPLAYCASAEIIFVSDGDPAEEIINETWDLLMSGLNIRDTGFETLEQVLQIASTNSNDR
jgi:hypothetical protein